VGVLSLIRDVTTLISFLIAIASGTAGILLLGNTGGLIMMAIAATGLMYAAGRSYRTLMVRRRHETNEQVRQLKAELQASRNRHQKYVGAVTRLIDRQSLLYDEELEVTVLVGEDDEGDEVIERHVTTPTPFLPYRSMRPLSPRDVGRWLSYEDLDLQVKVENGETANLTVLPLFESGNTVRILVLFEPPVANTFAWTLRYRPTGLWAPLRRDGIDWLAWDARTPLGNSNESTYTRLSMHFIFPTRSAVPTVRERGGRGLVTQDSGSHEIHWREKRPSGTRYVWDLAIPGGLH